MAEPLGVGIIGCGGAALDVVRAAAGSAAVRIVAVHDRDPGRARDLAERSGARVRSTRSALLDDPAVDAVYVALPHDLLARTAIAALRAGRHVLVEKPLAITLRDVRRVRAASRAAGRAVGVLYELRQAPAAVAAADLVRAGAIGKVTAVRIRTLIDKPAAYWSGGPTGRASDPWRASRRRAGGGVVLMNASHQLDLVRAITGLEVVRVAAEIVASVPGVEVEDRAVATFRFTNDAVGSLVASAHAAGIERGEEIDIDGSAGAIRVPDPYGRPRPLRLFLRRPWGAHAAGAWLELDGPPLDPWAAALDRFAGAIAAGRDPSPGLDDAEAALASVLAIYRSSRTGRIVRLDPAPTRPEEDRHA